MSETTNPKTVYVVTAGEYSDHRIAAIFSTQEKAEAYVTAARAGDRYCEVNDIEEWEMDEWDGMTWGPQWAVVIRIDDGTIAPIPIQGVGWNRTDGRCDISGPYGTANLVIRVESPISADHAVKVAVEKRQEWLRTRAAEATQ